MSNLCPIQNGCICLYQPCIEVDTTTSKHTPPPHVRSSVVTDSYWCHPISGCISLPPLQLPAVLHCHAHLKAGCLHGDGEKDSCYSQPDLGLSSTCTTKMTCVCVFLFCLLPSGNRGNLLYCNAIASSLAYLRMCLYPIAMAMSWLPMRCIRHDHLMGSRIFDGFMAIHTKG